MRTIKFRGKVLDEPNEWVYGYLDYANTIYQEKETENTKCCGIGIFKVDENTIGEYTGLHDKNGKEIYEGDIVSKETFDDTKPNWRNISYAKVIYIEELAGFYLVNRDNKILWEVSEDKYNIEGAGNIYDNPELLEKGEQS